MLLSSHKCDAHDIVVRAEVDNAVAMLTQEINQLIGKIEYSVAHMRKAMDAKEKKVDDRDDSPSFIKAAFEPTLPRVGVIADELKNEDERATEIRRAREPDYIACAPKLPSILDDLPVVHAK